MLSFSRYLCMHDQSLSHIGLFATLWTVPCQAPQSLGFSRQDYWSGLPCPPPGNLPGSRSRDGTRVSCGSCITGRFLYQPSHWGSPMLPLVLCIWLILSSTLLSYKNFLSYTRRQWHPTPVLLPGKFHGERSLVGCSPWGRQELNTTERLHFHFSFSCIGEGNGDPLQYCCLENPRDGRAWWAAVYGVAQSRTRLKRLSSSSSSRHSIRHPTEHKGREDSSLNCLCSITHPHEQRVYQEILPGGLTWPLGPFMHYHQAKSEQDVSPRFGGTVINLQDIQVSAIMNQEL